MMTANNNHYYSAMSRPLLTYGQLPGMASSIVDCPTDHHKPFWHASLSLTCYLGYFAGGHPSQEFSTVNTVKDIKSGLSKKRCTIGDITSHFNTF